jgi:exosortase
MTLGALTPGDWDLIVGLVQRVPAWLRVVSFATIAVLVVAGLYGPVLSDLVGVWTTNPYYSYGFVVPLFSAWASWDARDSLRGVRPAWSWLGLGLAGAGLALLATGDANGSLTMRALSLPAVLAGALVLVMGPGRFAALLFPVVFLAFMAPLPADVIPAISRQLQGLAAWFTAHVLPMVGIPAALDGFSVRIPGFVLDVNESCNGLRFLLAMIVIGAAVAWSTRTGPRRRFGIVALAVVVALAANLIRVAGTGFIAYQYGAAAASGASHVVWGKAVYLTMLVPFALGVIALRRRRRAVAEPRELDRAA